MTITKDNFVTYEEILSQSALLEDSVASFSQAPVQPGDYQQLIFTGCGSSLFISQWLANNWRAKGFSCRAVPASEIVLYPDSVLQKAVNSLVFAFSRSGETSETCRAARIAQQDFNATLVPVTCHESTLSGLSHRSLVLSKLEEQSVVMTRAFTGIIGIFLSWVGLRSEVRRIVSILQQDLPSSEEWAAELAQESFDRVIFLGSGPFYYLASEAMLKVKEMTGRATEAWQTYEFRHGHQAILEPGSLVWLFASQKDHNYLVEVISGFQKLGAEVLVVGSRLPAEVERTSNRCLSFDWPIEHPDSQALALLHLPQLYAFFLAVQLGKNPDKPDKLSRVVQLEQES